MTYLQWMRENVGSTRSKRLYKSRKISRRFRKTFRKAENRRRFEASIAELVEDVNPVLADIRELSKLRSEAMLLAREICEAARATGDFRSKRYEYRGDSYYLLDQVPGLNSDGFVNRYWTASNTGRLTIPQEQVEAHKRTLEKLNARIRILNERLTNKIGENHPDYALDYLFEPRE